MATASDSFVQEDVVLPAKFLQALNEMRTANSYCDLTLKVDADVFAVHRLVLVANSPYFRAMFTSRAAAFSESTTPEVLLRGLEAKGVEAVLGYFYTSKIEINSENFEAVFTVANMWNVEFVLRACENFLRAELTPANCLGFQILVHQSPVFSDRFRILLDDFVNKNFMEFCEHEEFVTIPKEHLEILLKCDEICVKSEEVLFEAMLKWLNRDLDSRVCYASELLSAIRLGLISLEYLETNLEESVIRNSPECKKLIEMVIEHLHSNSVSTFIPEYFTQKRKSMVLYIFGGYLNGQNPIHKAKPASPYVENLDLHGRRWEEFPETCLEGAGYFFHRDIYSEGYVYIVGKKVMRFSIKTLRWEDLHIEITKVGTGILNPDVPNCGLCAYKGIIYAIGGSSNAKKLNPANLVLDCMQDPSSESCTPTNAWESVAETNMEHYRPGVCMFRESIYVIGGCDRTYYEAHGVTERLDLSVHGAQWTMLPEMPTPRWGLGAAVLNDQIFAVGGYDTDDRGPVNTVEVYTPDMDTWQSIQPMNTPRRRFGIATVNDSIFVVGGREVDNVEYYDNFTQKWVIVDGLLANRYDSSCFVMPLPQCL